MDKYIGFDMDSKKTVCCIVQAGRKDRYMTINSDIESMREFLRSEKQDGSSVEVVFEISGQAGFIYDSLIDYADKIKVANPSKMTWIYRTAKKNDRIDARKMAVLLSIGEIPEVHMPLKEVRQWRETILHRKKIVDKVVMVKNRIRATFKGHGLSRPAVKVYVVSKNGIHKLYTITILFFCTDLLGKSRLNDIRSIDPEYPGIDSVNSRFEAAKAQDNK